LEISSSEENSLLTLGNCPESSFLDNIHFWLRQQPLKDAETYITTQKIPMTVNRVYYDRSCSGKICDSSITENFKAIARQLDISSHKHLFIIRDFSYLAAIEKKDFMLARGILTDLERAFKEALIMADDSNDYLVILTTGDSRFVDMPNVGKSWYEFEKKGTGAQAKRTKLTNLVLASGARAENFCGIYEDSQVFERIMSGPKEQGLELKIINPFKN
jgi:hypothetical protein